MFDVNIATVLIVCLLVLVAMGVHIAIALGVTSALGVAFNSTLVALIISIVLMLLIHLLQSGQEGLILRLQTFCREQLIDKLYDHSEKEDETPEEPEADTEQ